MAWISENKYNLAGDISTGLTLDSSNTLAGSPLAATPKYGSGLYGSQLYQYAALYQGTYESTYYNNKLTISAVAGSSGDITYSYCISDDNITYTAFTTPVNIVGTTVLYMKAKYFKLRIYFHTTLWGDTDSFTISNIEAHFTVFQPDTIVDSNEMNANFQWIGEGTWFPVGNTTLAKTTGSYNIGSSSYKWNNVYISSLGDCGSINKTMVMVSEIKLSAAAASIEITGLNLDVDSLYDIKIFINNNNGYNANYFLFFNNVSASSYIDTVSSYFVNGATVSSYSTISSGFRMSFNTALTNGAQYYYANYFINSNISDQGGFGGGNYHLISDQFGMNGSYMLFSFIGKGVMTISAIGTITSLKIVAPSTNALGIGSQIQIWAPR